MQFLLNNNHKIPALGVIVEADGEEYGIPTAIRRGFRYFDLSENDLDYKAIGAVFKECIDAKLVERGELFVSASFQNPSYRNLRLNNRLNSLLDDLNFDYLDMLIVEQPTDWSQVFRFPKSAENEFKPLLEQLKEEVFDEKLVSICFNGFTAQMIVSTMKNTGFRPAAVKMDVSPYFQELELREYCRIHGIIVIGHISKAPRIMEVENEPPSTLKNPVIVGIARELKVKEMQTVFRWFCDSGMAVLTRMGPEKKLQAVQDVLQFRLSPRQIRAIDRLDTQKYSSNYQVIDSIRNGIRSMPTCKLHDGRRMPVLGISTWHRVDGTPRKNEQKGIELALQAGIRHFDCGQVFKNQTMIGDVLKRFMDKGNERESLFISSKVWNTFHSFEKCIQAVDTCLAQLQLDYLDLMLIHWPHGMRENESPLTPFHSKIDYLETWRALEKCVLDGKVRTIGMANFNKRQIQRVMDHATVFPCVVQAELGPLFKRDLPLLKMCREAGIAFEAAWPFGDESRKTKRPVVANNPHLIAMGHRKGKTARQIALRWLLQNGAVVLPRGFSFEDHAEFLESFDFSLSDDEMAEIDNLPSYASSWNDGVRDINHPLWPYRSNNE